MNFEKFIAKKAEPGEYDSLGSFTITGEKALEMLAEHTLQEPSQWILKMVQGAVAGGASRLSIKQLRQGTQLDFHFPQPPECQSFQRGILDPNFEVEESVQDLLVGIRVLLMHRQLILEWGHGTALMWNGAEFELCERVGPRLDVPLRLFVKNAPAGRSKLLTRSKSRAQMVDEIRQLKQRALFSPLTLELDGRRLDHLTTPPRTSNARRDHCAFSPRNLCAGFFYRKGEVLTRAEVAANGFLRDSFRSETPFVVWPACREQGHPDGRFGVFASYATIEETEQNQGFLPLAETFQIVWTRHGVVSGVKNYPFSGFGGTLQLSGDHVPTDISGLQLAVDELVDEGQEVFRALSEAILPPLLEAITNHQSRLDKKDLMEGMLSLGIAGGVTGYVAGAAVLTSGPAIVAAAAVGGVAGASVSNKDLPKIKGWLCRHLANSHRQLLGKMSKASRNES